MRVLIRDRTGVLPAGLGTYTRRRLHRIGRHLDLLNEAEAEFTQESRRSAEPIQVVELTLRGVASDLEPLRARESGRELLPVIDLAMEKLDREVVKLKERVRSHR